MSSAEFSLQAIDLCKDYKEGSGEALHVLRNINFTLKAGETAAIIGSSGSGKSTLLNLLGGLDTPTSGRVMINDEELFTINEKSRCQVRNQHLGFIYQFHHLLPEFTALENVAMPLLVRRRPAAEAARAARDLLERVGLGERLEHRPAQLSGGERQRAAVARRARRDGATRHGERLRFRRALRPGVVVGEGLLDLDPTVRPERAAEVLHGVSRGCARGRKPEDALSGHA
mgnify:CR=1 FL=1